MDMMNNNTVDLQDLLSSKIANPPAIRAKAAIPVIRLEALTDAALTLGTQGGYAKAARTTNALLNENAQKLDRVFDFNVMMVAPNVLAPVLLDGRAAYAQHSDTEIRIADRMFKIERPARFVPAAPTWRDYLQQNVTSIKVEKTHPSLLPKNDAEKVAWDEAVKKGWKEGGEQSEQSFEQGLARLKRDYVGMIQYRVLLKQGLVTAPMVAGANLGTTGGGDKMSVQDQVFRISVPSNLLANPAVWKNYPIE